MRIALVITELDPGGAELCLVNLACYLTEFQHEVKVFSLGAPPARNKLTQLLNDAKVPWHCASAQGIAALPRTVRWLRRELRRFQPDVVQSMLFHANVLAAFATANNLSHRQRGPALFGGARVRQPQRWRGHLQRWAAARMQKLVCVSQSVASYCHEQEGIPREKLLVIPNGIELSKRTAPIELASFGISTEAPMLLFVGRLDAQKGVVQLLEASTELLQELPNHQLVLVGDGPQKPALQAMHTNSPHKSRIHMVGWQPSAIAWMDACEQLLLPAIYEGMPNVVLEAMSRGKPVVCFDVDGVRELLGTSTAQSTNDCISSQVAPCGDYQQFAKLVCAMAKDSSLRNACGQQNRRRVEQEFQLTTQLRKYLNLYENTLKNND